VFLLTHDTILPNLPYVTRMQAQTRAGLLPSLLLGCPPAGKHDIHRRMGPYIKHNVYRYLCPKEQHDSVKMLHEHSRSHRQQQALSSLLEVSMFSRWLSQGPVRAC